MARNKSVNPLPLKITEPRKKIRFIVSENHENVEVLCPLYPLFSQIRRI